MYLFGLLFFCVGVLWPASKVLVRAGFPPWYCIIIAIPVANVVGLWLFATSPWPAQRG